MTLAICGQKIQHVLNGASAAAHGQTFKDFGSEDEGGDHQRSKELANGQRRDQRDGHRKLHRHAPLDDVLECFFEDGIAADQRRSQAQSRSLAEKAPTVKPDRRSGNGNKDDPEAFHQTPSHVHARDHPRDFRTGSGGHPRQLTRSGRLVSCRG